MTATKSLLLVQLIVLMAVWPGVSGSWYQTIENPYTLFGTKTTYSDVSGEGFHFPSECTPLQVWMLCRHGTRYPSKHMIKKINRLDRFKTMITDMSQEKLRAIYNWKSHLTLNNDCNLQSRGVEEMKSLATRLKSQLPQLFKSQYDEISFKFMSSNKPRTKESINVFFESMFNEKPKDLPIAQPSDYRLCLSKWKQKEDDENDEKIDEEKKFEESSYVQSVVSRVSKAMGLEQNLSYEDVSVMFESCKYETAWTDQKPAWCAVFTIDDFEILGYLEDLRYYYASGYGNPDIESMGCPILKDMIDNFKKLTRGETGPNGIFYFGHTPNILSMAAMLGIGKDDTPLLSTNYENMKSRQWKTSYIDPYAANIIAVFFKCKNKYKVMFSLNENVLKSKDRLQLYSWQKIEAHFEPIISKFCTP
ncbi:Hypothetical protein CINCED_3A024650 [Cinara cedri]|nr:Hypothetical protein CINCED_3A024650 [Cinara cedri]